jgi:hypothetical protein
VPSAYTADELIGSFPADLDAIVAHHKEVFHPDHQAPDMKHKTTSTFPSLAAVTAN